MKLGGDSFIGSVRQPQVRQDRFFSQLRSIVNISKTDSLALKLETNPLSQWIAKVSSL